MFQELHPKAFVRCLGLILALANGTASKSARAAELLLCAGGSEMFLIDAIQAEQGTPKKLWRWSGDDAVGLANDERTRFHHLDECRAIEGGSKILVTASNSGCALVDRATGKVLWHASVTNAHSIELLPRNRVVVASSLSGDHLVLFDLARSNEALAKTPVRSAHGVIWDEQLRRLWALGFGELRSYELKDWETDRPALSLGSTYHLPDNDGHDLRAVPNSNDLILSTENSVFLFDREHGTFRPHPSLESYKKVKTIDVHPTTERIVVGQWGAELNLLTPAGKIRFSIERPYKARWLP
jgi:Family of unknown function (DUF6528)